MSRKNSNANEPPRKLDTTVMNDRELSFHSTSARWPASLPSSDNMAEAGFYFTPSEKYSDCTTCYRCGIKMFNWLPDDTPKFEHRKFSPSCKEVKTWTIIEEDQRGSINRAEQTESRFRSKLVGKAKRFTDSLHRKSDLSKSTSAEASHTNPPVENQITNEPSNDDKKLADIRSRREVAEKSLDGLKKLASFYPSGSVEQKRAEQSMVLQVADIEKLRDEERKLAETMGALSFGREWKESSSPVLSFANSKYSDESPSTTPETRPRSNTRPLPQLPSQLRKNSMPRMPARLQKSQNEDFAMEKTLESTNQQDNSEWVEYFTDAGVPYYYNTNTKLTVWEIPQPNPVA